MLIGAIAIFKVKTAADREEIKRLSSALDDRCQELEAARAEIRNLSQTLRSKQADLEEAQDRGMEVEKKRQVLHQQLKQYKSQMEDLEEKFTINRKTFALRQKELERDIEEKETQLVSESSTCERLKGRVKTLEEELEALGSSCREKDREIGKLRREVQSVSEMVAKEQMTEHLERLKAKVKEVDRLSEQVRKQL